MRIELTVDVNSPERVRPFPWNRPGRGATTDYTSPVIIQSPTESDRVLRPTIGQFLPFPSNLSNDKFGEKKFAE